MNQRQSWTVGIMCYNEAGTIRQVVADACDVLSRIADTYEVLVVDDGSTDGTRDILKEMEGEVLQLRVIMHPQNKGIGGTLRTIYTSALYENVGNVPGDGQFDIKEYLALPYLEEGSFVAFYRKNNTTYSLFRNVLSLINKKVNEVFIGITLKDVNWTKVYKRSDLQSLTLELESSLVESEIVAKLLFLGRKAIEPESKYLPRTYGVSKGSSWKIVKKALADTVVLVKVMKRFRKEGG